ncbi:MAG: hypothetical protein WKG07_12185 [Hymenobacter sp.]
MCTPAVAPPRRGSTGQRLNSCVAYLALSMKIFPLSALALAGALAASSGARRLRWGPPNQPPARAQRLVRPADRTDPTYRFVGMKNPRVQLLVHGPGLASSTGDAARLPRRHPR